MNLLAGPFIIFIGLFGIAYLFDRNHNRKQKPKSKPSKKEIMKKIISILLLTTFFLCMGLMFVNAQSCCLTVTINCDGSITAVAPIANPAWVCQMSKGQTSNVVSVAVQPDGQTFLFPIGTYSDTISIAFTYHDGFSLGCGYSTYIVNPYLGRTVTGCSGGSTCIVTDVVCPNTPVVAPSSTTTKKRGRK